MLANFFSIGDRNYLNNAVVISDALTIISKTFGNVADFKIQFRKPFLSQGEFKLSTEKLDGHITGQFKKNDMVFFFAYTPTDISLEVKDANGDAVKNDVTPFNVCYHVTDVCRGAIEEGFEKVYGPMTTKDKVIFVMFEIPCTAVFNNIIIDGAMPPMTITPAEQTGDRRFKVSVYVGGKLLGHRHSTVKEFIV